MHTQYATVSKGKAGGRARSAEVDFVLGSPITFRIVHQGFQKVVFVGTCEAIKILKRNVFGNAISNALLF